VSGSNLHRSEACCAPGTTVVPLTSLSDSQTGSHSGDPSGLPPSSSRFFCSSSASLVSVNLKDLQSRRTERQIADSARVVTVPKAEPMARRLSCSACPATAVQGFPARPAPAQTARFARTGYERLSGCGGVAAASRESGSLVLCDILVVLRVQDCQKNLRGAGPGRGLQARPAARISSPGWRDPSVVCLQETSTAARPVNVTRFRTRYGWPVTVSRPGQGSCRPGTGTMPRLGSGR